MDIGDWAERWRQGRIGFHEGRPNAFLERHVGRLGEGRRILVPLCGKTEDMAFLAARGHAVVGVEAVEEAVVAFFREHDLEPDREDLGPLVAFRAGAVTILAGDVFACTREHVGAVDALYDRAALIALPEDVRRRYVDHLRALLAPGSTGLVVTFDHPPESGFEGPPFPVGAAEVRRLYEGSRVELVDEGIADVPRPAGNFVATERCYVVTL
jgi:thiopurine S-methyltransferase